MSTRIAPLLFAIACISLSGCNDSGFAASSPSASLAISESPPEVSNDKAPPEMSEKEKSDCLQEYSLAACAEANSKKVLVCHVPAGNPAAAHTICIAEQGATHGHGLNLAKPAVVGGHGGDRLGACESLKK